MTLVSVTGPKYIGSGTQLPGTKGSGWVIGDGFVLTAGHVVYEWNRSAAGTILPNGPSTILDYRSYRALYQNKVQQELAARPNNPRENVDLEGEIASSDTVVISRSGVSVSAASAGLVGFVSGYTDLPIFKDILGQQSTLERRGQETSTGPGEVVSAFASTFRFSKDSVEGDSGGAYLIKSDNRTFVLGTHAGNDGVLGYGTFFSTNEVAALTGHVVGTRTGNISGAEPINMLIGSVNDDPIGGTERPDIILGRGGADTISGETSADPSVWGNDQLFGGNGDDVLDGRNGNDLLHGGDRKQAGEPAGSLNTDGKDTASYSSVVDGPVRKGVMLHVIEGNAPDSYKTYSSNPDFLAAIFVKDLGREGDVDTLISVEKVTGTGNDDIFRVDGVADLRFAGSDDQGGLREVDLAGHEDTNEQGGDWVDASRCETGLTIDLNPNDPFLCVTSNQAATKVKLAGIERISGSKTDDVLKGNGDEIFIEGGEGNDEIHLYSDDIAIGGPGADKFYFYTDRSDPNIQFTDHWNTFNNIYILDFEQDDTLYVDGQLYNGYTTTGQIFRGETLGWQFELTKIPDQNGVVSYAYLGIDREWSPWIGQNDDVQSLGLLELRFHLQDEVGVPRGASVKLSNYKYGEGGITFDEKYLDGHRTEVSDTLTIRSGNAIDFQTTDRSINGGAFYAEPVNFFNYDFSWLIEENSIPTNINNYATIAEGLINERNQSGLGSSDTQFAEAQLKPAIFAPRLDGVGDYFAIA